MKILDTFDLGMMHFKEKIHKYLSPNLIAFGWKLKEENIGFLVYQKNNLQIIFSYDYQNSFEVDMTLLNITTNEFYSLYEIDNFLNLDYRIMTTFQTQSVEYIIIWINQVSLVLDSILPLINSDDDSLFTKLREKKEINIKHEISLEQLESIKKIIQEYWRKKDYLGLIRFVEQNAPQLPVLENKKYEYAKRKQEK